MKRLLFALVIMSCSNLVTAQVVIKGKVLDNATSQPVIKASVYLNNTSAGTVTNSNGEFILSAASIFTGELIISCVGYQPLSYQLKEADADKYTYTFRLDIKESVLQNIIVMDDASKKKWMTVFKDNFLGITEEADNCSIENPGALYFSTGENKNALYAYADTPLVLINKLLGYKISFDLLEFSFDKVKMATYFLGYSRYEEMGIKKKWIKKRKQNYFGSVMHFYRSLTSGQLQEQGYSMYRIIQQNTDTANAANAIGRVKMGKLQMAIPAVAAEVIVKDSTPDKFYLQTPDRLMVQYNQQPHAAAYLSGKVLVHGLNHSGFTAYITLLKNKVALDGNGIIYAPLDVVYDGYWIYEKLANQLPYNYYPD